MNRSTRRLFAGLLLVPWLAACADEPAPEPVVQPGAGAIFINLSGLDSVAVGAMVKLIVDRTSSPAANNFVIKERPLEGALFVLDQVFVPEAVYRVTIEVRDANGQVFLKGTTSGVSVLQGQTTSVTVVLEPSGAVQVVAELAAPADRFELLISSNDGATPKPALHQFVATQRVVPDGPGGAQLEYVGLALQPIDGSSYRWIWRRASTPLGLLIALTEYEPVTGLAAQPALRTSITAVGSEIFAVVRYTSGVVILRGDDDGHFEEWTDLSFQSSLHAKPGNWWATDSLEACHLLLDNQFNLFCVVRHLINPDLTRLGMVRSYSQAGVDWSPLPPYMGPDGTVVDGPSFGTTEPSDGGELATPLWISPHQSYSAKNAPYLTVMHDQGVFRLWVAPNEQSQAGVAAGSSISYGASLDRRTWTALRANIVQNAGGGALTLTRPYRGLAVFKTDAEATWQMIIVDKNGERWLATSVDE